MAINIPVVTKYDPSGLRKANKGFEGFAKNLKGLVGPALLGAAAAGGAMLVQFAGDAVKAAAEDAKSQLLLARQLVNTTKATRKQVAGVEKFIEKTSMATGVVDDDLRPAFANLVRGTGSVEKAQKLMTIALDGAAASGKPLNSVVQALIKANNGQTQSLYRLAPELKKTKGGIDDFAKSVKGAAAEAADPFARLNVLSENLTEKFGALLLPYIEKFVDYLIEVVAPAIDTFLTDLSNPNTELGAFWQELVTSVTDLASAVKRLLESDLVQFVMDLSKTAFLGALQIAADGFNKLAYAVERVNTAIELYKILSGETPAPKVGTQENAIKSREQAKGILEFLGIDFEALIRGFTPKFATGGIVMPKKGGTLATVAEAGQPEAIIPLSRLSEFVGGGGGNTYNISVSAFGDGQSVGRAVVDAIRSFERTNGAGWRA